MKAALLCLLASASIIGTAAAQSEQAVPQPAAVVAAPAAVVQPKPQAHPKLRLKPGSEIQAADPDVYDPTAPGAKPLPASVSNSVVPGRITAQATPAAIVPAAAGSAKVAPTVSAALTQPATAQQASEPARLVKDFTGRFLGSGSEVALNGGGETAARRMSQVEISGDEKGFTVTWATVKLGNNFKPVPLKSSSQTMRFVPTATPNYFVAQDAGESTTGKASGWAKIKGATLTVVKMETLDNGTYSVQHYDRTLTEKGMDVAFSRFENGQVVRTVRLNLARAKTGLW